MKKIISFLAFMCFVQFSYSQVDPVEPCCAVIAIDARTNLVTLIDKTTGQLYQFKAGPADLKNIKDQDAVTIVSGKITSVGGVGKTYAVVQPDYGEPCCNVVNVQPDPVEPCCSRVTYKNNSTGETSQFKIPKNIIGPVSIGDPVYAEPCCNIAVVQIAGSNGQMNSYGYAASVAESDMGDVTEPKWDLSPLNTRGTLGRLALEFPAGVEWSVDIYSNTGKFITNRSHKEQKLVANRNPYHELPPGVYRFKLNTVMVENVPIEKGKLTRLRSGVLDIANSDHWEIRSEDGKKYLTSGNKPKKLALPAGKYQVGSGNYHSVVEVKDQSVTTN